MIEARLAESLAAEKVRCHLCSHRCVIAPGKAGVCTVRLNQAGTLYTQAYGHTIATQIDPIEKKPLYHFIPGSRSYSIATPGCNFKCGWCQNWEIAHAPKQGYRYWGEPATPKEIVAAAQRTRSRSIAYTYTEPTIFFEYAFDTAQLAKAAGLANVFVTNGYMTPEMLDLMAPYLDGANVDLKSFSRRSYARKVGARLQAVLDNLVKLKALGIWVEVTTLIIPNFNDDPGELKAAAQFIARELGMQTPWHLSRFFPAYKALASPPTPFDTLMAAYEIGRSAGLEYVYLGNIGGGSHTDCPACEARLIERFGYSVTDRTEGKGRCPNCNLEIPGVF
jgi:pyruvate formate lyase activating enzyme